MKRAFGRTTPNGLLLTMILVMSGSALARADVGIIQIDKANQQPRSGDRFRVSVTEQQGRPSTVNVFIKHRDDERLVRADLTVSIENVTKAMIPVRVIPSENATGFYVELAVTRDFATTSRLGLLVDSTNVENVGTVYLIDLASYFPIDQARP